MGIVVYKKISTNIIISVDPKTVNFPVYTLVYGRQTLWLNDHTYLYILTQSF